MTRINLAHRGTVPRSRGGVSTKIHAITDTTNRPSHITLTQGQRQELLEAKALLEHARGKALLGDSGYDSNEFRQAVRDNGMMTVIENGPGRKSQPSARVDQ